MQDFEKLGVFYLGRVYDMDARKATDELVLYESKDLVTHALCVGMTGSGKTGLCVDLLEEAAIDGIPAIAIDPKGDLANLLLTFPSLDPAEFRPWVSEEDARAAGLTLDQAAAQQAELWRKGLAAWGQDENRIRRFRGAVDLAIYTPGSSAGLALSVLKSFSAPAAVRDDPELLGERIQTTVAGLLTLVGVDADPVRSREHILLSSVLAANWREGRDLDLGALIHQIQSPPISRVGVMDLETFYPAKERFELAMRLNGLLAAPGFEVWMQGDPLDVDRLLYTSTGKPRLSVISIAHLSDAERMFFVSLLFGEVLGWMRGQPGTTSLRALLYMDEIAGYMPPVANPPSKPTMLTLLKQARAFGVGVVLATQNPVDLDYKGLSNIGTWFLGRLQTERDQARVLDGLEGVSAASSGQFDRSRMEQMLAGLGKRLFLLHNVHEDQHEVFESRWAMSYLRGPLTRDQIKALMAPCKGAQSPLSGAPAIAAPSGPTPAASQSAPVAAVPDGAVRPVLPPGLGQYFLPVRNRVAGAGLRYQAAVFGAAKVQFSDSKLKVDQSRALAILAPLREGAAPVDWDRSRPLDMALDDLENEPQNAAGYGPLPAAAAQSQSYDRWQRDFTGWIYQTQRLELLRSPSLEIVSRPEEAERDFRIRLQTAARERRDQAAVELRGKYGVRMDALKERIRRAEEVVGREREQATAQKLQTAVSFGATILGAFLGRKSVSVGTLGRATTAARGVGRSMKETQDVARAEESVEALRAKLQELETEFQAETAALDSTDVLAERLETVSVKPKKTQIDARPLKLVWAPYWEAAPGGFTPAWE